MTAPDYTELRERLNAVEGNRPDSLGICTMWHRNPDGPEASTAIASLQADNEALRNTIRRTMTDPQRMIWRDDVEDICPSPAMCFEYGEHVRCGPCAVKQAAVRGVETDHSVPNLPEVYRLRRELASLQPKDQSK